MTQVERSETARPSRQSPHLSKPQSYLIKRVLGELRTPRFSVTARRAPTRRPARRVPTRRVAPWAAVRPTPPPLLLRLRAPGRWRARLGRATAPGRGRAGAAGRATCVGLPVGLLHRRHRGSRRTGVRRHLHRALNRLHLLRRRPPPRVDLPPTRVPAAPPSRAAVASVQPEPRSPARCRAGVWYPPPSQCARAAPGSIPGGAPRPDGGVDRLGSGPHPVRCEHTAPLSAFIPRPVLPLLPASPPLLMCRPTDRATQALRIAADCRPRPRHRHPPLVSPPAQLYRVGRACDAGAEDDIDRRCRRRGVRSSRSRAPTVRTVPWAGYRLGSGLDGW